jgi:hypothetical protein
MNGMPTQHMDKEEMLTRQLEEKSQSFDALYEQMLRCVPKETYDQCRKDILSMSETINIQSRCIRNMRRELVCAKTELEKVVLQRDKKIEHWKRVRDAYVRKQQQCNEEIETLSLQLKALQNVNKQRDDKKIVCAQKTQELLLEAISLTKDHQEQINTLVQQQQHTLAIIHEQADTIHKQQEQISRIINQQTEILKRIEQQPFINNSIVMVPPQQNQPVSFETNSEQEIDDSVCLPPPRKRKKTRVINITASCLRSCDIVEDNQTKRIGRWETPPMFRPPFISPATAKRGHVYRPRKRKAKIITFCNKKMLE